MDFHGTHDSQEVELARNSALKGINSINSAIDEIESGTSAGRVYSILIDENRINIALDTIRDYEEIAQMYNEKIDNKVIEKMEETKINLINILNESNDPDINKVIEELPIELFEKETPTDIKIPLEDDSDNPFNKISRETINP